MAGEKTFRSVVTLARGYQFVAEFPDLPQPVSIPFDEPAPLGDDSAPNAAAVLGAAVGNCLAASLTFCLRKARADVEGMTARVATHVTRNGRGKFRISGIDVELLPGVGGDAGRFARCGSLFDEFCVVTQSVREGIPVNVVVREPADKPVPIPK